jgi:hypothetical protein
LSFNFISYPPRSYPATTYLNGGGLHPINQWAKTQPDGGLKGLLECGARSFDFRPGPLVDGKVYAHHGSVTIKKEVSQMFDEVVDWAANSSGTADDLVVIGITDASGVVDQVKSFLAKRNITFITNCAQLHGLSAAQATENAKLPGGGAVMATFDCWRSNYVPANACSGYGSTQEADVNALTYSCHADSKTKDFPVNRMTDYIDKVLAAGPPTDGQLYTVQALWQETAASVELGTLALSSLIDDEKRSALNKLLTTRISSGAMNISRLGLLEVNNVCDAGPDLLKAMRAARS